VDVSVAMKEDAEIIQRKSARLPWRRREDPRREEVRKKRKSKKNGNLLLSCEGERCLGSEGEPGKLFKWGRKGEIKIANPSGNQCNSLRRE